MRKGVVLSDGGMGRVTLTLILEGKTRLRRVVGFCSTSFLSRLILGEEGGHFLFVHTFCSFTLFVRFFAVARVFGHFAEEKFMS